MNIVLVYAPDSIVRQKISRHIIEAGSDRLLFAEHEEAVVTLALDNDIKLVILFDPRNIRSIVDLKDYIRSRRRHTRVRILPSKSGQLFDPGWQEVIDEALKPIKPRKKSALSTHPRFKWPAN